MSFRGASSTSVRWFGLVALTAGLVVVALRFPTRPADAWDEIEAFALDGEECKRFRDTRLNTALTLAAPDVVTVEEDPDIPKSFGEAADAFGLELALVCRANDLSPACEATKLPLGTTVTLPLYYDPESAPARPRATDETAADSP